MILRILSTPPQKLAPAEYQDLDMNKVADAWFFNNNDKTVKARLVETLLADVYNIKYNPARLAGGIANRAIIPMYMDIDAPIDFDFDARYLSKFQFINKHMLKFINDYIK